MKFLVAMDSFKGCLGSLDAGRAVAGGIRRVFPDDAVEVCPVADGGEGTVAAMAHVPGARRMVCDVEGPYGNSVRAGYVILPDHTAVLEMAQAAGLNLSERRDPALASTYGVGMMIREVIGKGCRHVIIGIGGSATNDGGAGMLQALGFRLLDRNGRSIARGATGLKSLAAIDSTQVLPELDKSIFHAACDVTAPLLGPTGCSLVFGPQKGADIHAAHEMDKWLNHYADIVRHYNPDANPAEAGSGAAGGLGFALKVFCHAELLPGLSLISRYLHLEEKIQASDFIITGEGRMDCQSSMGKLPARISAIAKNHHKPVIALVGGVDESVTNGCIKDIDAVFPIPLRPCSLDEAMNPENACKNLAFMTEQVLRVWRIQTEGIRRNG